MDRKEIGQRASEKASGQHSAQSYDVAEFAREADITGKSAETKEITEKLFALQDKK